MRMAVRINKFLASCGLGSRRGVEALVEQKRVKVNGHVCTDLSYKVEESDQVHVDDKLVGSLEVRSFLYHKPAGLVCSHQDEQGRATIYSDLPADFANLHHVGRLDLYSEGLLILSNDGELTQKLLHPSHQVEKEYHLGLDRACDNRLKEAFLKGIEDEGELLQASSVKQLSPRRVAVVLQTGKNRQLRRMVEAMNYKLRYLRRVRMGSLTIDTLRVGRWRRLQGPETQALIDS